VVRKIHEAEPTGRIRSFSASGRVNIRVSSRIVCNSHDPNGSYFTERREQRSQFIFGPKLWKVFNVKIGPLFLR
jgi:hypothetical protein